MTSGPFHIRLMEISKMQSLQGILTCALRGFSSVGSSVPQPCHLNIDRPPSCLQTTRIQSCNQHHTATL